jgi:hypothetical protein
MGALIVVGLLVPGRATAQTSVTPAAGAIFSKASIDSVVRPTTASARAGLSRKDHVLIGLVAGAGAGVFFGEIVLGQRLDLPHGPDMLLGAAMGAGVGALTGFAVGSALRADTKMGRVSVAPVVSKTKKAVVLTWRLGR